MFSVANERSSCPFMDLSFFFFFMFYCCTWHELEAKKNNLKINRKSPVGKCLVTVPSDVDFNG